MSHTLNDRDFCVVYTAGAQVCGSGYVVRIIIVCGANELSLDGEWPANRMYGWQCYVELHCYGQTDTHNPQERRSACIISDSFPLTHRCTLVPPTLGPSYCKLLFVHPSNALSTPRFSPGD